MSQHAKRNAKVIKVFKSSHHKLMLFWEVINLIIRKKCYIAGHGMYKGKENIYCKV
jgi:hypothetical protein